MGCLRFQAWVADSFVIRIPGIPVSARSNSRFCSHSSFIGFSWERGFVVTRWVGDSVVES